MSLLISHTRIKEKLKEINLPLLVSIKQKEIESNSQQFSQNIGRNNTYLHKRLQNTDQPISLLLLLSMHLQTNFLDPYQNLLPENIRPTQREKQLQQQLLDLQKQLDDVKKERDLFKEIVMK